MTDQLMRTPLYEEHLALGARMVPVRRLGDAGAVRRHHRGTQRGAPRRPACSTSGTWRSSGSSASAPLTSCRGVLTNDLARIAELGHAQYTLMLDEDGHIIDDLIVYHSGDLEYLIIANASNHEVGLRLARAHTPPRTSSSSTSPTGPSLIALQGPRRSTSSRSSPAHGGSRLPGSPSARRPSTRCPRWSPAPATRARTAWRYSHRRSHGAAVVACDPVLRRGHARRTRARATPFALRWAIRSTAATWTGPSTRSRPGSVGSSRKAKTGYIGAEAVADVRESGAATKLVGLTVDGRHPAARHVRVARGRRGR